MYSESLRVAHTWSDRWHGAADGFSHGTVTHERAAERKELMAPARSLAFLAASFFSAGSGTGNQTPRDRYYRISRPKAIEIQNLVF